jgi:hypothetical protein
MRKTLTKITKPEFEAIPKDRRITARSSVQIEGDRQKAIADGCPMDTADAYLIIGEKTRSFADLFGQEVFFDNWRSDFDRIAESFGYPKAHPSRQYVQAHGYGTLDVLDIIYVAFLKENPKVE